jgi:2-polyprenyl-3-methyl-5-hydroxy-6-metoxy-1,4-benzoquinol methylase
MEENNNKKIIESWNVNATHWIDAIRTDALETRRLVTNDAIVNAVLHCGGTRILDVGCGEGWLSHVLAKKEMDVTGFDVSPNLIGRATKDNNTKFHVLSYENFAAEPELVGSDFDVAVCNFSLLGNPLDKILEAIDKVTNPSGHLLIQTLHPYSSSEGLCYEDGWREEDFHNLPGDWSPMPWYFRTMTSWISVLRSVGWHIYELKEPLHPATGKPASLILDAVK